MGKDLTKVDTTFLFCDGGSCRKAGSEAVVRSVRAHLRNSKLMDNVHTIKTRCNGRCEDAPTCIVQNGNYWYKNLTIEKGLKIAKSHIEEVKPIEQYLLYHPDLNQLTSEAERTPFQVKPFELKDDPDLGKCFITRGLSSDQYLHPLFLFLFENSKDVKIKIDNQLIPFSAIQAVEYTKPYAIELITASQPIEFVIGSIPKSEQELQQLKITITEYYVLHSSGEKGIRFKNKQGKTIALLLLGLNSAAWNYCTEVHLQGVTLNQPVL